MFEGELRGVDTDDGEAVGSVGPVPWFDMRQCALTVDARVGPEVHHHHLSPEPFDRQRLPLRRVQPLTDPADRRRRPALLQDGTAIGARGEDATGAVAGVTGNGSGGVLATCTDGSPVLQQCGTAPPISGVGQWLNTPEGKPLSIAGLRGKVVMVDFWTYSCINCQRTLPHVEAWNRAYAADGLTIIGVHTPEFAFEHVVSNVSVAARQLGVVYPVAIDNQYTTWNAYENSYWPAEYLIDASGHVRHVDFGEGHYQQTESFIRQLLVAADPEVVLPRATDVGDTTPTDQTTPETYLGYQHPQNLAGQTAQEDRMATYQAPASIPQDEYAYNGQWSIGSESATAGQGATLSLRYQARDVYLVIGGSGTIKVSVDGVQTRAIVVAGVPRLYQLVGSDSYRQGLLSLAAVSYTHLRAHE